MMKRQNSIFSFFLEEQEKEKKKQMTRSTSPADDLEAQQRKIDEKIYAFYTIEALNIRRELRFHEEIEYEMKKFWKLYRTDEHERLFRQNYLTINQLLAEIFLPFWDSDVAFRIALKDWNHDTKHYSCRLPGDGTPFLDQVTYCDSLFEIIDLWCDTIEYEDYIKMLQDIYQKLLAMMAERGIKVPSPTTKKKQPVARRPSRYSSDFSALQNTEGMARRKLSGGGGGQLDSSPVPGGFPIPMEHLADMTPEVKDKVFAMVDPQRRSRASAMKWKEVANMFGMANVAKPVTLRRATDIVKDFLPELQKPKAEEEKKKKKKMER
mmetsp:Transcript_9633/g.18890  ORF Transcript_9633/g.18890 Transcript_9633/m.18890 type:complete len:322 (+) Transcript_9633:110-1075(+)